MAFWGMGLTQSDEFCQAYDEYLDMYAIEHSTLTVTACLLDKYKKQHQGVIPHNVCFAVAKAQWRLGELSESLLLEVDRLIECGENIKYYRSLGFTEEDLAERQEYLFRFQKELRTARAPLKNCKVSVSNKYKRLPKGTVSWYEADDGYYGFVVLDAVYEGRLLAVTQKLPYPPQDVESVLDAPAMTAIWMLLQNVPKENHDIGEIEISGSYNGRAGVFICKPISFGINFTFHLNECHRRVLLRYENCKMRELLQEENVPIQFFCEETAEQEMKMVLELMKNPASNFAREKIKNVLSLEALV